MSTPHQPLRVMSIMAHQDDFEFNAGGSFALLRESLGEAVTFKIIATTSGASGHHRMDAAQTVQRRHEEAEASAALIGAQYERLKTLSGEAVGDGQFLVNRDLLGGLWNAIRSFRADVVFCPPVAADPLAGVHIDHEQTAIAVRYVGYQLAVPRAYPTLEGEIDYDYRSPLIINVDDIYHGPGRADVRQDISAVYDVKLKMSQCHRSQTLEWLPFVSGNDDATDDDWARRFLQRHHDINRRYNCDDGVLSEYFRLTRWGRAPREGELETLFPHRLV